MSPIQGISGAGAAAATYAAPKAPAIPPPKAEVQETAQDERAEVLRGAQELSERPAPSANPSVGSRLNVTA